VIKFHCEICEQKLRADESKAGRRVKCARCGSFCVVPDPAAEAPAATATAPAPVTAPPAKVRSAKDPPLAAPATESPATEPPPAAAAGTAVDDEAKAALDRFRRADPPPAAAPQPAPQDTPDLSHRPRVKPTVSVCIAAGCLVYLTVQIALPWTVSGRDALTPVGLLKVSYKDPDRLLEFFAAVVYLIAVCGAWVFGVAGVVKRSFHRSMPVWLLAALVAPASLLLVRYAAMPGGEVEALAPTFYLGLIAAATGTIAASVRVLRA